MKKEKQKSIFDNIPEVIDETDSKEYIKEKQKNRKKWKAVNRVLDRLAGFIIAAVLVLGTAGLVLEYKMVKGPSETYSKMWVNTFSETRRFDFINNLFLSQNEVDAILNEPVETPVPTLALPTQSKAEIVVNSDAYDDVWHVGDNYDDDGDGIIYFEFKESGSQCYMLAVQDPKRIFIGTPGFFGGNGLTIEEMVNTWGAVGGINAGGFIDNGGSGTGGYPDGITIVDGVEHNLQPIGGVGGFDADGNFFCGDYSMDDCRRLGLVNAVSFEPVLVVDGAPTYWWGESGSNPRTAIGQRADGTVIMLCVDGRQFFSMGLNYEEIAWIMIDYGCVNAINMDGGSSSCMMFEGEIKNNPTNAAGGSRYLPTAWLIKKQ